MEVIFFFLKLYFQGNTQKAVYHDRIMKLSYIFSPLLTSDFVR